MHTRLSAFCTRLIEAGWLAVAAVIPAFFNVYSSRVFEPDKLSVFRGIVLIMVVAWLVKVAETVPGDFDLRAWLRRFLAMPLVKPVLVFAAVYVMTTITSIDPGLSFWGSYQRLQGTLNNLLYVALFLLVATHIGRLRQIDRLVSVALATSLLVSLYGILQHFKLDPLPWGGDVSVRVTSSLGNPIFLGAYLLMVVPLTLGRLVGAALALRDVRNGLIPWRLVVPVAGYAALIVVQLVAILYTVSRGPWLGLGAALVLFGVLALAREGRWRLVTLVVGGGVLASIFVVLLNLPGTPVARLRATSPYLDRLGAMLDTQDGTARVRILIWQGDGVGTGALGLITASPIRFLIGYGPETMYVAYNRYYPPDLAHYEARNASPDRSHNDFLDFLVTMGALGLVAYLAVLVSFFWLAGRLLWRTDDRRIQLLLIALIAGVAGHLVEAFFGIAIAATRTHFFLYLGMTVATALIVEPARTAGAAAPAMETVSANQGAAVGGSAERGRKSRGRRGAAGLAQPMGRSGSTIQPVRWPIACWLAVTTVAVPVMLLGNVAAVWQISPEVQVLGGFGWLVLGIVLTALAVEGPAIARASWQRHYAWLYGLLIAATAAVIVYPVLGSVIADVYFKKGQAYDSAGRYDLSIPAYLTALWWAPHQDFYDLFLGRAYLELARRAPDRTEPAPVIATVADLAKLSPTQLQSLGREQLFQASFVALREAYRISPLNTDNAANLGRLHRFWAELTTDPVKKQERFATAERWYQQATTFSPHAAHLYDEWGVVYHLQGRYDDAIAKYQIAEQLDDRYAVTFVYLGDAYLAKNDLDRARTAYERALALDPNLVTAYSALGYIYQKQGKLQEALAQNLKAQQLAPNDPITLRNLAILYSQLGMRDQALASAEAALKVTPKEQQAQLQAFVDSLRQQR